jgi:hypothetical protein
MIAVVGVVIVAVKVPVIVAGVIESDKRQNAASPSQTH